MATKESTTSDPGISGVHSSSNCVICETPLANDSVKLFQKGIDTLLEVSRIRGDTELHSKLSQASVGDVFVHRNCRKKYTDKHSSGKSDNQSEEPTAKKLRSSLPLFDFKTHCFFCSKIAADDTKHPDRDSVVEVRTMKTRYTVLKHCDRLGDIADAVRIRLNDCVDLVAAEARYHNDCYKKFTSTSSGSNEPHRPVDRDMSYWFEALCHWLENDGDAELYTLFDLHDQMSRLANGADVYGEKYLKKKLIDHYGDHVFFAQIGGSRKDVVCFKNMASYIVSDEWYKQRTGDIKTESERVMIAAAKLVREEIREKVHTKEFYPELHEIENSECEPFLTPCLQIFLETLIKNDLKRDGIGQAITQAARPKSVISPLLFGLGVELHHIFGSKWLIEELSTLGFSITYDEVQLFKQSLLQQQTLHSLSPPPFPSLGQYSADNADSNIRTLDGTGTFHGMGIIAWYPREHSEQATNQRVRRIARVKVSEVIHEKSIPIIPYSTTSIPALSTLKFKPICETLFPFTTPPVPYYSRILWRSARIMASEASPNWSNWSGFMQCVYRSDINVVNADEVMILPIIDLNPSDETCIFSTLSFIEDQVTKLRIPSTSVTFDQPLFIKAFEIASAKRLKKLVIRLGGFHTLMSAVSSVFHTMRGSGIEEALGQIFGPNVIVHILSGKAIARALRAIFLLDACLSTKLLELIMPNDEVHGDTSCNVDCDTSGVDDNGQFKSSLTEKDVNTLQGLIGAVLNCSSETLHTDIVNSEVLQKLNVCLDQLKISLSSQSRTAKLWIQLLNYIGKIEEFVACERLKDWNGHLRSCGDFLNLFAATGHIHYAKSARLYLQSMSTLSQEHPWLHQKYAEGAHAVERTEHSFNGLWSDLVIEQTLMCSLKSRGGLTHGRGLTESVRHQWVFTLPTFAAIHDAMTTRSEKKIRTSQQHVDLSNARKERDFADLNKLLAWFSDHSPFDRNVPKLRSLSTGLTAEKGDGINCDSADDVGCKLQLKMDSVSYNEAKLKRSEQIKTLQNLQPGFKVGRTKTLHVDPAILFSRCSAISQRLGDKLESYFQWEMCLSPPSLFKDNFLRKAVKSELADALYKDVEAVKPHGERIWIVDGGWLLHYIRWKHDTYQGVLEQYSSYLKRQFGKQCIVVFDGYPKESTKDHEHKRRKSERLPAATVDVNPLHRRYKDQESFFSNITNKVGFIAMLTSHLEENGHVVKQAQADADTLIVTTAISYAENQQKVEVIANDTDILILLLHHWKDNMEDIYIHKVSAGTRKKLSGPSSVHCIKDVLSNLCPIVKKNILFIHAWSGCDTTSSTFGHSKTTLMTSIVKHEPIQNLVEKFYQADTQDTVGKLGISLFISLFGGGNSQGKTLSTIRFHKYQTMIAQSNILEPQRMPPTERAAHFHSLRVFLQVKQWMTLDTEVLDPCLWGWESGHFALEPVMTDMDVAPENVLKFIRCKCKTQNPKQCYTNLCTCFKHGIKCVEACGGCHGMTCKNTDIIEVEA